jgi:hypothetical protein
MNKSQTKQVHARKRARQRYHLKLTKTDYEEIVALVKQGKAETLERQSIRVSLKLLVWNDQELYFIYDNKRGTIVTFLSKDMIDVEGLRQELEKIKNQVAKQNHFRNLKEWEEVKANTRKL